MMPAGRPSKYREEFAEQAQKLCLLGATDAQLGDFFEVDERTINRWKDDHPEFRQSLKEGRDIADAQVVKSLYRRALGYEHEAVKIVADAKTGAEHIVPYTERFPPDVTACIFWLKNRQSKLWRDQKVVENNVNINDERVERTQRILEETFGVAADDGSGKGVVH